MGRSKSIGSIYAELSLSDKGFTQNLKVAGKHLKDFGQNTRNLKGGAIAAGAAIAALGASTVGAGAYLAKGTKDIMDMGGELSDTAERTGLAVKDVMRLQRAFKDGGLEAEDLGASIAKMQKNLVGATNGGDDPFAKIGLSAKELINLNPARQFELIGAALSKIENPARRNAMAMEIFGKSGYKLGTVLGKGLSDADKSLGKMPEVMDKFAGAFDRASDLIGGLPVKSDQFFTGFASGIIGTVLPGLEKINGVDFTEVGQKLGVGLVTAMEGITDGTYWRIFQNNAYLAVDNTAGEIVDVFGAAFEALGQRTKTLFSSIADDIAMEFMAMKIAAGKATDLEIADYNNRYDTTKETLGELYDKAIAKRNKARGEKNAIVNSDSEAASLALSDKIAKRMQDVADQFTPEPIVDPIQVKNEAAKPIERMRVKDDEFIKRGLALRGSLATGEKNQQVTLLEKIRDILARIERDNPQLKFA